MVAQAIDYYLDQTKGLKAQNVAPTKGGKNRKQGCLVIIVILRLDTTNPKKMVFFYL
jgi:hypothetical protein